MIARPASCLGSNPVKSQFRQIKLINKDIDHPNWIVLIDPVFQAFGKQCALLAIRALNEALHPTLRRSQESALRESHEGGRFHTARVKVRHRGLSELSPLLPQHRTLASLTGTSQLCQTQTPAKLFDHLVGAGELVGGGEHPDRAKRKIPFEDRASIARRGLISFGRLGSSALQERCHNLTVVGGPARVCN